MKKFTKLIALLLTLAMVLSMLPSAAFGATTVDGKPVDEALVLHKSYDNGVLTLESYVTGTTSINTTSVTKPCDIVLVLDVSGSMDETVTIGTGYVPYSGNYSKASIDSGEYYYKDGDEYYRVYSTYDDNRLSFRQTWLYYTKNGVRYYLYGNQVYQAKSPTETPEYDEPPHDINGNEIPGTLNWPLWIILLFPTSYSTVWNGTLYRIGSQTESKLNALKTAVNGFIDSVADNATENDVEHRISIVKFAGDYPNRQSASTMTEGNNSGRTEVVKNLTSVLVDPDDGDSAYDDVNSLHSAVDKLVANGATYADYGMTKADYVLDPSTNRNYARSDSQKVVVLFTDGEPNHGNGFDSTVANTTISRSYGLKNTDHVKVYTVGIYDNPSTNMTNYMNYTSSNYPNAQSMTNSGLRASTSYYRRATTASDLNNIFAAIASEAVISTDSLVGEPYIEFNSTPVMRDVISEYFMLPDDYTDGLKAYYVEQTACIEGEPIFGSEKTYLPADAITVDGKTVKVTGFDYDTYYVTTDDTSSGMNKNNVLGRKLVVEVPIVPDPATPIPDALLDQDPNCMVPTNDDTSGVLDGEDFVEPFEIPEAPVPSFKIVHCGATTDTALHTTERFLVPDDTFDLTKAVNDGVLYGGTFTDSACTVAASEDATKFVPEAGKTYYMWEVSKEHLLPKNLCAYRPNDNKEYFVEDVYLITAIDRQNYDHVGFLISGKGTTGSSVSVDVSQTTIYKTITAIQSGVPVGTTTYYDLYKSANPSPSTTSKSLVACYPFKALSGKAFYSFNSSDDQFKFQPYWVTLDGVQVVNDSLVRYAYYQGTGYTSLKVSDTDWMNHYIRPEQYKSASLKSGAPLKLMSNFVYGQAAEDVQEVVLPEETEPEVVEPVAPAAKVTVYDGSESYEASIFAGAVTLKPAGSAGKLFAGWYADAAYTKLADLGSVEDGDAVYAKYVSNDYLNVKYTDSILTKKLTLISAIDSRDYAQTGYIISVNGEKRYVNIDSYANSYLLVSAKTLFGSSISKSAPLMIYEMKLTGIAKNSTIKITPFAIGKDGTEIFGEERTLVYTGFSIKG